MNTSVERKKDYGLLEAVNKGLIPCLTDGGMRGLADELNPNGVNEVCNWHSVQRLGLHARGPCLSLFDEAQSDKMTAIMAFCVKANRDISKKDMKKKKIPSTHAKGINSYLDGLKMTDEDRLRICSFTRPHGWKAQFNNDSEELSESDNKIKRNLMASRGGFPKIKVIKILSFCALNFLALLFCASSLF